jgi:hypothetical protein
MLHTYIVFMLSCCCPCSGIGLTIQLLVVAGPMQLHAANPALTPDAAPTVGLHANGAWPRARVACDVLPPRIALHAGLCSLLLLVWQLLCELSLVNVHLLLVIEVPIESTAINVSDEMPCCLLSVRHTC